MAHNFKNLGKNTTFVSRKELPWHRLGKVVDAMTSAEAIKLAGMDFNVALAPLYAGVSPLTIEESFEYPTVIRDKKKKDVILLNSREVLTNFATYREDTNQIFGVVGSRYEVVQNFEAFDFFDSIIGEGHASYETAGAFGNGEKIFITAKLPSKLIVKKEDIDKYLLLTMAHDGSGSIQAMFTPIRVVCNNTLSLALASSRNKVTIRHTKNARTKLDTAAQILGIVKKQTEDLSLIFNKFADERLTDIQIMDTIKASFNFAEDDEGRLSTRAINTLNDVLEYHEVGVGQENIRGTKWGVFNAVTGYQQNGQTYKNVETQFDSLYNKQAASIRQNTFQNLLKL
jgi:phage/plasmid-like protein (TIGR03299 family)